MSLMCFIIAVFLGLTVVICVASSAMAASATESAYKGWKTLELDNGFMKVQVAPEIGGRIIQLGLADFEYLWVNEQLAGQLSPPSGVGPNGEWLNYGGDKLWPAPQGWARDDQWPGPPDPVLDGSPHRATVLRASGTAVAVQLTSGKDQRSGIQLSRVITVFDNAARVSIDATMKNIDTKPRRWGIWSNTQLNAANRRGHGYNQNMWAYCPINPKSMFPKGYNVMFGLVNNPSYKPDYDSGIMRVHYERLIGKIGLDCSAGWTAVVDGTDGYAFVQRFTYCPDEEYTDGACVEIWMDGLGKIYTGDKVWEGVDDPLRTPHVLESEVLSPYAGLQPGETYTYHYDWYVANIGGNYPALDCTDVGLTCEPLTARLSGQQLTLTGRFGVFYPGTVKLAFLDANDAELGASDLGVEVHPARPFAVSSNVQHKIPARTAKLCLLVVSPRGQNLGELACTQI